MYGNNGNNQATVTSATSSVAATRRKSATDNGNDIHHGIRGFYACLSANAS